MQRTVRLLHSLLLAVILSCAASFHTALGAAEQDARAGAVTAYFEGVSRGDAEAAFAQFDESAIVSSNGTADPCYRSHPCSDPAEVRQQVEGIVATRNCQTVVEFNVAGAVVTGRLELRGDAIRANGVERIVQSFMALVPEDKITFLALVGDVADPETALNLAIN